MSGLHFAFGLVVAVIVAAGLFKGRQAKPVAVVVILVGWGALVLGSFFAALVGEVSRSGAEMIQTLFQTTAGAGLVIGSMIELLSKKQGATT